MLILQTAVVSQASSGGEDGTLTQKTQTHTEKMLCNVPDYYVLQPKKGEKSTKRVQVSHISPSKESAPPL